MIKINNGVTQVATIEGYASIFGAADLNGDIIAPGAFAKKLIPGNAPHVKMLYQHLSEKPIGIWEDIVEDKKGLFVRGRLILDNDVARNVWTLLRGGAIDGLSIGFKTKKAQKLAHGRRLLEVDLWEISIVTFPMARQAKVTKIGDAENTMPPNVEKLLRQVTHKLSL